jgi:4-amino-4-deoxy-L-arabinose transferase-like glycosyltransferase
VALFLGALYFLGLGRVALLDPDEPVYANVGREMLRSGDWLTPHRNGALWFDKPPLFHWVVAASQALFGATAWASRLPSAVAASLLALLIYAFGRRTLSPRAALIAAVAIAGCVQTVILARAAVTDMLFATCFAAACCAWYLGFERAKNGARWSAVAGVALGLATLTKGPVAPALLGAIAFIFAVWEQRVPALFARDTIVLILAWLATAGPWYGAMLAMHPREFTQQFLVTNNLVRFTKPEHPLQSTPFYYYVPVLLAGFFPWSPFLALGAHPSLAALGRVPGLALGGGMGGIGRPPFPNQACMLASLTLVRTAKRQAPVGRFLLVWVAVVFGFFSLSQTKLVTYIYPLYPAAALLVGQFLDREPSSREGRAARLAVLVLALLLGGVLVATATRTYPAARPAAMLLAGVLALGALVAWRLPLPGFVAVYGGMMAVFAPLLFLGAGPAVERRESTHHLARWAARNRNPPVVGFRVTAPSFEFYSGRGIAWEKLPDGLRRRLETNPELVILTDGRELARANEAIAPRRLEVVARAGRRMLARATAGVKRP